MTDRTLLRIENFTVEYLTAEGNVRVIDRVSFKMKKGEIFGLAGETGSGKTTIVHGLLRLLAPPAAITGGRVLFDGVDVLAMDRERLRQFRWRKVSLVMQSAMNALNPLLSIGEQIGDVIEAHEGIRRRKCVDRIATLLDLVGIERSRMSSFPHELSGGMRQRVVIAMALALKPELVIMDEPTTALDVVVQNEILAQIARLKDDLGFSVLFITHDLSTMLQFCSHIGILYAGRLVEKAPAKEILERPRHPYTRALMDSLPDVRSRQKDLVGIGGSTPDVRNPPPGCRFHPRCPQVIDRCSTEQPRMVELGGDHLCACHLFDDE
jgi:peptide/nickel transport system ATP-binding protein